MKYFLLVFFVFLMVSSCSFEPESYLLDPYNYEISKQGTFTSAAVSSAHPLASEIGRHILNQGGNAMDAAIAVHYALAVVYPNAGNIGGGGFMIIHTKDGDSHTVDFSPKASLNAHRDMFLDFAGNADPDMSQHGHLAPGVPGAVAGMDLTHEKFGTMEISRLIQPAIDLAEKGFAITESEADGLNEFREDFLKYSTRPTAFVRDGQWQVGDTLVQEELANTLKRIARYGARDFYEGETARLIVEEMERGGGIITEEDLKVYTATERNPIVFDYKGHEVITMNLPSSGGVLIQQMMEIVKHYPVREYGFQSKEAINLMVEIERRAYADRSAYFGDPDFVEIPYGQLVDPDYLQSRMAGFIPLKAGESSSIKPGLGEGWTEGIEAAKAEKEETTHFSIIDKDGNMVSLTTTINSRYGSRVVVGGAGFILNNEMDDFSAKPGSPNRSGLLGTEANAIAPGKRMLSSMSPTIIRKDQKPYAVIGTPGGATIITSVFQTLLNLIEFEMSAADAVNSPKFHHQWYPDVVFIEKDFDSLKRKEMEAMGYALQERGDIGRTELLLIRNGVIEAIGDKRGDDSVAGY